MKSHPLKNDYCSWIVQLLLKLKSVRVTVSFIVKVFVSNICLWWSQREKRQMRLKVLNCNTSIVSTHGQQSCGDTENINYSLCWLTHKLNTFDDFLHSEQNKVFYVIYRLLVWNNWLLRAWLIHCIHLGKHWLLLCCVLIFKIDRIWNRYSSFPVVM